MTSVLRRPPIVVIGVDEFRTSDAGLRWATREAATRRIPIRLVGA